MKEFKVMIVIGDRNGTKTVQGTLKMGDTTGTRLIEAFNDPHSFYYIKDIIEIK